MIQIENISHHEDVINFKTRSSALVIQIVLTF